MRYALRLDLIHRNNLLMAYAQCFARFFLASLMLAAAAARAAPVTVNGATFDAPAACAAAEGALVCKEGEQQLELWVYRKPLSASAAPSASLLRKMADFNQLHETAVANIMKSTGNDQATPFASYGSYPAVGSAMAGKGVVRSPTARFASVLHGDEVWQFLEVVATRTAAIEALSAALQSSLVLPTLPTPPAPPTPSTLPESPVSDSASALQAAPKFAGSPLVATFSAALLSLQHPGYLSAVVIEDTASRLQVNFTHKTRATAGPNLLISVRAAQDKPSVASIVKLRKDALAATMAGTVEAIEINKLGAINGAGFALIGTAAKAKGVLGVELLETTFVANVGDRLLEVRLTAEQQYAPEARMVWSTLANSITLAP